MEHRNKSAALPGPKDEIDPSQQRRRLKSTWDEVKDLLTAGDTVFVTLLVALSLLAVMPQLFAVIIPSSMLYYLWVSSMKFRLPFKAPMNWGGTDYGAPKPGGKSWGKAAGILYFGQDQATLEELWIENGDARRHGFFLGTTGSGKALPLDTPILTPRGWVLNGEIGPGETLIHPKGGTARVLSVHPQGAIPAVRLWFADGRHADCSMDHLWEVTVTPKRGGQLPPGMVADPRVMTAGDIGILTGLQGEGVHVTVPLSRGAEGPAPQGTQLSDADAIRAAEEGLEALGYMPSTIGTPKQRLAFLGAVLRALSPATVIEATGLRLLGIRQGDARVLKQIVWSLGGLATTHIRRGAAMGRTDLLFMVDGLGRLHPDAGGCRFAGSGKGLDIVEVERLDADVEMSCIKTDRDDGLYVMENHVVTHNTELLLGVVSQTLMWSSGFLFIDGKGTTEFYARAWTLAKRFGREDDVRVLNFTDPGGDPDAPAGGPTGQSNTVNPFAKGSSDQLMNIVVSLMGDAGTGNDMWKNRAMSLVTAEMKALCELRNAGDILLNVQTIRDFLALGKGMDKAMLRGKPVTKVEDVPEEAWEELRTRAGMIELYLRALKGDFSNATLLSLRGFFDTLPGFNLEKALKGEAQDVKCNEQYGFLSMQLTKPLGSLADDYGHIFRTPLGEVDIDDVVLNRRIMIVLLPALQKAAEEMQNCGKIIVTMTKIMMGNASGSMLQGSRQEIVDAKQTRSPSPFIAVLDEAGYYMVKGIDVMMAQARSLGFMVIVAGQDMAAMQSISPQIAETAAANASIFAVGKTVDGDKTLNFIQKVFGRTQVSVTSGFQSQPGLLGNKWVDRMDASFQEVDRVKGSELQNLGQGEFYFLFDGTLVKGSAIYVAEVGPRKDGFGADFSVNKFLKVRGPTDRVPGLDQSVEIRFIDSFVSASEALMRIAAGQTGLPERVEGADRLAMAKAVADRVLWSAGKTHAPGQILDAWTAGLLAGGTGSLEGDAGPGEMDIDEMLDSQHLHLSMMEAGLDIDELADLDMLPGRDPDARGGRGALEAGRPSARRPRGRLDDLDDDFDLSRVNPRASSREAPPAGRPVSFLDVMAKNEAAEEDAMRDLLGESLGLPPETAARAAEEPPRSLGRDLQALAGADPGQRHRGMIGTLVAQQQARMSAMRRNAEMAAKISRAESQALPDTAELEKSLRGVAEAAHEADSLLGQDREDGGADFVEVLRSLHKIRPVTLAPNKEPQFPERDIRSIEGFMEE